MEENKKKILMTGGGTGGSVIPLLAVAEELFQKNSNWEFVFVGTVSGPDQELIREFGERCQPVKFISLLAGKWRRYFSIYNIIDIFKIILAFFKANRILKQEKPNVVITAGSFVSVPVIWAAGFKKIPVIVHQQDVRLGLANKLMAPWAQIISVTFAKSLIDYGPKAVWLGNPISHSRTKDYLAQVEETRKKYRLRLNQPVILVIGGGTGALALNRLMENLGKHLVVDYQIIHLTGKGKQLNQSWGSSYQSFEFLSNEEVLSLMALADLVISRCGLGTLTELSALAKPAILIPIPNSHQEDNASLFANESAAIVLDQKILTPDKLLVEINRVLSDNILRTELSDRMGQMIKQGAAVQLAKIIQEILVIPK